MYFVCVDRGQSRLEQLELLLILIVSVYNHLKLAVDFIDLFPRYINWQSSYI